MRRRFPRLELKMAALDFTTLAGISGLDGIIMANSLHFQKNADEVLRRAQDWLKPLGSLVIVEYNVERPNPWVPFPVPFRRLATIADTVGIGPARLLATRHSRYHGQVYSALLQKPAAGSSY